MIITTSICTNYLPKAMALADSVKRTNPECKFVLCLVEREVSLAATAHKSFDDIILAKDMGFADFDRFIFKHSIVEASTAVKGQLFEYLYKQYPNEQQFVYLDPDTYTYSAFTELTTLLERHPIIIAPHLLAPGHIEMELSSLKHGVFNLGFLAVNRSDEAKKFISWWTERLNSFCYDDIAAGLFTDQKWINLAPCFFDTLILKHPGYDYATWTLKTFFVEKQNEIISVNGFPLRFIHFSGFDSGTIEWAMREWLPKDKPVFSELYAAYKEELMINDQNRLSATSWTYDYYMSGEKIAKAARVCYRSLNTNESPFSLSNEYFNTQQIPNSEDKKQDHVVGKAVRILHDEGIVALFNKTLKYTKGKIFNVD